jgi:putative DNA modification/repair radical SAM protein
MDLSEKLRILGEGAKYDVSCSSSGSRRTNKPGGTGDAASSGICHTFTSDGRCISLLKILLTNTCIYDCAYCVNRRANDLPRAAFAPEELANLVINFYRRNYIEGLFLSSGVVISPDHTMELMIKAIRQLREVHNFNGYIHLKAIPGASPGLVDAAGRLVDRMSINMELTSDAGLKLLAPDKTRRGIIGPMTQIKDSIINYKKEKIYIKSAPDFVPAGQSTQLIIGATPETDLSIVKASENLYRGMNLKRVYYSAYVHVNQDSRLPVLNETPLLRENRFYQADWLMRFYGFKADEILDENTPFFDNNLDPKAAWALRHLDLFPVEVNAASYENLLRIPGIGVKSAQRIIKVRKLKSIRVEDLKKLGVVLKRARYFLTVGGVYAAGVPVKDKIIRTKLLEKKSLSDMQLKLFEPQAGFLTKEALNGGKNLFL